MTPFGTTPDGRSVVLFTLVNAGGVEARIMSYGGTLVSLRVPDRDRRLADVILGFDDLGGYLGAKGYLGALIGRHANRIGKARFSLGGVDYPLAANDGENHLHGGLIGFDKAIWDATPAGSKLLLRHLSKDGDEGYPGNLSVEVGYTLRDDDALEIEYSATTDRDTVVNLTHHAYFNLAGQGEGDILGHLVTIDADEFVPIDAALIPTGAVRPVGGTPFDFTRETAIGARIDGDDEQLVNGLGYDHTWVIRGAAGQLRRAARVHEPKTGRVLEVLTTEPGLQFYSGNFLDGVRGKGGAAYDRRTGLCLETQHYPDSPNQRLFPTTTLRAGDRYHSVTVYRFSAE
jgi:aldose 1-epimerase